MAKKRGGEQIESPKAAEVNGKDPAQTVADLSAEGWRLYEQAQFPVAAEKFAQILELDPENEVALRGRVGSLRLSGSVDEAQTCNKKALKLYPQNVYFLNEQAWIHYARAEYDSAVKAFDQTLAIDPGNHDALQWKITSLRLAKRYPEAGSLLDDCLQRFPGNVRFLNEKGWLHYNEGDYTGAAAVFSEVLQIDPLNENASLWRVKVLRTARKYAEAESAMHAVFFNFSHNSRFRMERGWLYFDLKKYADSETEFAAVLTVEPENADAFLWVLKSLRFQSKLAEAESALQRALKLFPDDIEILLERGWLYYDQKEYEKAAQTFERVLKRDANNERAWEWRVAALRMSQNFSLAEQLVTAALERFPEAPRLWNERGWLYYDQRNYDEAYQSFVKTLSYAPDNTDALLWKVTCLRMQKKFGQAETELQTAMESIPNDVRLVNEMGWLLFDQKKYADAVQAFDKVLELDETYLHALLWRCKALRLSCRYDEAISSLDKALGLHQANSKLLLERAWVFFDQRQYAESEKAFEMVLANERDNEDAIVWRLSAQRMQKKYDGLLQEMLATLERFPQNTVLLNEVALLNYDTRQYREAADAFQKTLDIQGEDSFARLWHGLSKVEYLTKDNRYLEALQEYQTMKSQFPEEPQIREQLGWFYIRRNDYVKAKSEFKELLQMDENNIGALNGIGGVHFSLGEYQQAEEVFRQVLDKEPMVAAFYTNLAWALTRQADESDLAEADKLCQKALEFEPDRSEAFGCLGVAAYKRGNYREAEAYLLRSIEASQDGGSYTDLGSLYVQMGNHDEAEKHLRKAIEINQDDYQAHIELGDLYLQTDRKKQALWEFRRAMFIAPDHEDPARAMALAQLQSEQTEQAERTLRDALLRVDKTRSWRLRLTLSRVLYQRGVESDEPQFFEEALEEISEARKINPHEADIHFQEGIVRSRLDDYERALGCFRACLDRKEDHYEADRNLRKLREMLKQERQRTRGAIKGQIAIGILFIVHLVGLWYMYLTTDKITSTMMTVLVPVLLGLIVISFVLPFLIKLRLPGLEAELSQPEETISRGPTDTGLGGGRFAGQAAGDFRLGGTLPKISSGPN